MKKVNDLIVIRTRINSDCTDVHAVCEIDPALSRIKNKFPIR